MCGLGAVCSNLIQEAPGRSLVATVASTTTFCECAAARKKQDMSDLEPKVGPMAHDCDMLEVIW